MATSRSRSSRRRSSSRLRRPGSRSAIVPPRRARSLGRGTGWALAGLGVAAVGAAIFYATRSEAVQNPLLGTPITPAGPGTPETPLRDSGTQGTTVGSTPTGVTPDTGSTPHLTTTPDRLTALIARLRSSDSARAIFAFQARLYSHGFTGAEPDGIEGPITDNLVRLVNNLSGFPTAPARFSTAMIQRTGIAWPDTNPDHTLRVIPQHLPSDVIALVNATIGHYDPGGELLQALPS